MTEKTKILMKQTGLALGQIFLNIWLLYFCWLSYKYFHDTQSLYRVVMLFSVIISFAAVINLSTIWSIGKVSSWDDELKKFRTGECRTL